MTEELIKIVDEYLDKFMSSDLVLIKIKDENYPMNSLKRMFLIRINERNLKGVTSYTFMMELYLEKI
ncbi:hypothetical protein E4H04_01780 [Candidatus Bathyarchaeota archaeon]|nr:MAG: hypothetical protein E4H04_01780 [Candidatus Bathyarchaeota archaeon]